MNARPTPDDRQPATARDVVLSRIRRALADVDDHAPQEASPVERDYRRAHPTDDPVALLAERLADYRAVVHRASEPALPGLLDHLLAARGSRTVAVPRGLPPAWLVETERRQVRQVLDDPNLTAGELDTVDSVVTGCSVAIAETGTLVLDGGPDQGSRQITLVPDHHVCVVRVPEQVVDSVPGALQRLTPTRPLTWISGPSATSDIELSRVEGVHGPRTLEVVLLADADG